MMIRPACQLLNHAAHFILAQEKFSPNVGVLINLEINDMKAAISACFTISTSMNASTKILLA